MSVLIDPALKVVLTLGENVVLVKMSLRSCSSLTLFVHRNDSRGAETKRVRERRVRQHHKRFARAPENGRRQHRKESTSPVRVSWLPVPRPKEPLRLQDIRARTFGIRGDGFCPRASHSSARHATGAFFPRADGPLMCRVKNRAKFQISTAR